VEHDSPVGDLLARLADSGPRRDPVAMYERAQGEAVPSYATSPAPSRRRPKAMPLVVAAACVLAIACAVVLLQSQPTGLDSGAEKPPSPGPTPPTVQVSLPPGCVLSAACDLPRSPVRVVLPWVPVGYLKAPFRDQLMSGRNGVVSSEIYYAAEPDVPSPSGPVARAIRVVLSDNRVPTGQLPGADWVDDHIGSHPARKDAGTGTADGQSANVSTLIVDLGPGGSLTFIGQGLPIDDLVKMAERAAVL
jgi:hypothetical protein